MTPNLSTNTGPRTVPLNYGLGMPLSPIRGRPMALLAPFLVVDSDE